jgi:hypothetical protein
VRFVRSGNTALMSGEVWKPAPPPGGRSAKPENSSLSWSRNLGRFKMGRTLIYSGGNSQWQVTVTLQFNVALVGSILMKSSALDRKTTEFHFRH